MDDIRRAWQAEPLPGNDDELIARADEVVRDFGDLPEVLWYEAVLMATDSTRVSAELLALRPADAEPYQGGWI